MNFLRAVGLRLTWRRVLVTVALGLSWALLEWVESVALGTGRAAAVHFLAWALFALLLVPAVACADEAHLRGVGAALAYSIALLLAIVLVGAVLRTVGLTWLMVLEYCLTWGLVSGLGALAYVNRQAVNRILEGIRGVELQRVQLERHLVESELAMAQAQIDPNSLIAALQEIREALQQARPEADQQLNSLILKLRAALARTVVASSGEAAAP